METSTDYISVYRNARDLARKLERYWKHRGLINFRAWIIQDKTTFSKPAYYVRSNLRMQWDGKQYNLSAG